MKKTLYTLFTFILFLAGHQAHSQCNAEFTWEQIPGTLTIHFNNNSTSEHDIISYQWIFGDGQNGDGENPNHTYANPGTYNVCLIITDSEGCVSDVCHMVLVAPIGGGCEAAFNWEQGTGLNVHFIDQSDDDPDIISWMWNFGDGHTSTAQNPVHEYSEPGVYLVCLIIENELGCESDVCHEVVVEGASGDCEAAFAWEQGSGLVIHFIDQSDDDPDIISWMWNFGDGHTSDDPDPVHEYAEPGVYLVCLIVENEFGCQSDVCHEVVVEAPGGDCEAAFIWEQGSGLVVHFIDQSDDDPDIISWMWNFGDGHTSDDPNPVHEYAEPGVYLVCLIVENEFGCLSDVCHEVVVEGPGGDCEAAFIWEQGNGLVVHFIDQSDDDPDIVSWHWNFGDGHTSDDQNPVHEYDHPGVYLVCLIVVNEFGCAADVCHEVVVEGESGDCEAAFIWDQGNGLVVHFIDQSDDDPDIVSWHWNFGDGHTSDDQNPVHEYDHPGVYVVCLIVVNEFGCAADVCHEVVVEGEGGDCEAAFIWEQGNGLVVHFIDQSDDDPDIVSWVWHFGDGSTGDGQNPVHEYDHPGVYLVCLTITNELGCVDEVCHEVVVEGEGGGDCEAAFTWEQGNGLVIHFIDQSDDDPDIISWVWNFGDGHMGDGQNPVHEYAEPGVYLVCLIVTNEFGCVSDVCHEVVVEVQECEASFNFEYSANGEIVFFNNNSTGGSLHTTWLWEFGDGHTSTEENPHHNYEEPGIYTVCLTMTDSVTECYDEFCFDLIYQMAYEDLHSGYNIEVDVVAINAPTAFTDDVTIVRYTNPAAHLLHIQYYVSKPTPVLFDLYSLDGRKVISEDFGYTTKGRHDRQVVTSNLKPGFYVISLTTDSDNITRVLCITE